MKTQPDRLIIFLMMTLLFLVLMPTIASSVDLTAPNATLIDPVDGNVSKGNITFIVNATDNVDLANITLYHNISGTWQANQTKKFGEFEEDGDTLFLCHWNNDYTCIANGSGTATYVSTTFKTGRFGQGVALEQTDTSNLTYPTASNMNKTNGTIEFWFKPNWNYSDGNSHYFWDSTGSRFLMYKSTGNFTAIYTNGAPAIAAWPINYTADNWYHVAYTYTTQNQALYINGSLEYTDSGNYSITGIGDTLYIGSRFNTVEQLNATVDELRLYDRALSASEVSQSYQNGVKKYTDEQVTWTINNIPEGSYLWNALAYDKAGYSDWADINWSFTVSFPPLWKNQGQNLTHIPVNGSILLYTQGFDETALDWAVLETNESGAWENKTVYGSPMDMGDAAGIWTWSNFTWQNTSLSVGSTVYWRIWYNDTAGNWNSTGTMNFSIASLFDSRDPTPPSSGGTWTINEDVYLNGSGWGSLQTIRINITDGNGSSVHDSQHQADAQGNFTLEFADLGTDYPSGLYTVYVSTDAGSTWIQYDTFTVSAVPEFPLGEGLILIIAALSYGLITRAG